MSANLRHCVPTTTTGVHALSNTVLRISAITSCTSSSRTSESRRKGREERFGADIWSNLKPVVRCVTHAHRRRSHGTLTKSRTPHVVGLEARLCFELLHAKNRLILPSAVWAPHPQAGTVYVDHAVLAVSYPGIRFCCRTYFFRMESQTLDCVLGVQGTGGVLNMHYLPYNRCFVVKTRWQDEFVADRKRKKCHRCDASGSKLPPVIILSSSIAPGAGCHCAV